MSTKASGTYIPIIGLCLIAAALGCRSSASPGSADRDHAELEAVERQWLAAEHDPHLLDRILAEDFLHPVSAGVFLTKEQHVDWASKHPLPPDRRQRFAQLHVRTYGDTGIVSGIVVSTSGAGHEDRTIFTDIFVRRNGAWQAVGAQETAVQPPALPE